MEVLGLILLVVIIFCIAGGVVYYSSRILTWMATGSTSNYHRDWE